MPAGERALVRAATWCAGRWVVVGATAAGNGRTRPAVWTSPDARTWHSLRLRPGSDFYTAREILTSVACSHGRLALLGAMSGGAHGIPRTATWQQQADGSLAAVRAPSGSSAGRVRLGRRPGRWPGWLPVTGTRTSGAAVWQSATGASFRLYDGAPGLANTSAVLTQASDAMSSGTWTVAGVRSPNRPGGCAVYVDRRPARPWTRLDSPVVRPSRPLNAWRRPASDRSASPGSTTSGSASGRSAVVAGWGVDVRCHATPTHLRGVCLQRGLDRLAPGRDVQRRGCLPAGDRPDRRPPRRTPPDRGHSARRPHGRDRDPRRRRAAAHRRRPAGPGLADAGTGRLALTWAGSATLSVNVSRVSAVERELEPGQRGGGRGRRVEGTRQGSPERG